MGAEHDDFVRAVRPRDLAQDVFRLARSLSVPIADF